MSLCSYIYDANGLRWEEGSLVVRLLVNGEPRVLAVVRSGQGTSRVDRFEGVPHPLDGLLPEGKVTGEISVRDLEALTFGSPAEIKRAGHRFTVRVPEDVLALQRQALRGDRSFPAEAFQQVGDRAQGFAVGFLPSRAQGEAGRRFDETAVQGFVAALSSVERKALALVQVASMPKSGRAGGPMARRRLRFFAGELTAAELIGALEDNPDALLHVTPGLVGDFAVRHGGDAAAVRGFDRLVESALLERSSEGGNVLLASLYAHMANGSDTPAVFPTDVDVLRASLIAKLSDEVRSGHTDMLALEVLATSDIPAGPVGAFDLPPRMLAVAVLRSAFAGNPTRTLSPTMGVFLVRLHDRGAPELLDSLLEDHPAQVVSTPDFFVMLPTEKQLDVVLREPRMALEHLELDRRAEEVAVNELFRRNEPAPMLRSEVVFAHRHAHATAIREVVDRVLRDLTEFESVFGERLRQIRQVNASPLERERLLAYGGLGTSLREFFWPALRRVKDLETRVELLDFEVRSPFQSPAGYVDAQGRRLLESISVVPASLESLRVLIKDVADRLESLRALARDGLVADFCADAERVFADVPVAMHRHLGVVLEALDGIAAEGVGQSPRY